MRANHLHILAQHDFTGGFFRGTGSQQLIDHGNHFKAFAAFQIVEADHLVEVRHIVCQAVRIIVQAIQNGSLLHEFDVEFNSNLLIASGLLQV